MHEHGSAPAAWLPAALVLGGALLLLAFGYLWAVSAGRRRGRSWSPWRTAALVAGVCLAMVALGPLGAAGHRDFVAHMWGHLLLGMAAPLLLVVSAPVTVLLRGLPAHRARSLSRLLQSTWLRIVSHPAVAAALNVGGLWLLYTTALHGWMHTSWLGHMVVHGHVLLAGLVFTAAILQVDPTPHGHDHRLRAACLVGFLALHAILGKHLYAHPPVGVDEASAQAGAQLMYYGGDYIDVVLIALFCLDWYRRTAPGRAVAPSRALGAA
ncbi:cytochrome c oxidase assembly protein [Luteococcus peritonei]|uniref:Cytochrome c oxidase assembly protein n=1 Tax=Luteococcus peritonei TaxID=88874 RepID=A0ABW4RYL2_9ACTN